MPEVSQADLNKLAAKLDTIISLQNTHISLQIDIKKELADLRGHHDQIAFALRRKGPINR